MILIGGKCPCGHEQTDDGWCEVVIGKEVHEIPHNGYVCRLCGRDVMSRNGNSIGAGDDDVEGVRGASYGASTRQR